MFCVWSQHLLIFCGLNHNKKIVFMVLFLHFVDLGSELQANQNRTEVAHTYWTEFWWLPIVKDMIPVICYVKHSAVLFNTSTHS